MVSKLSYNNIYYLLETFFVVCLIFLILCNRKKMFCSGSIFFHTMEMQNNFIVWTKTVEIFFNIAFEFYIIKK